MRIFAPHEKNRMLRLLRRDSELLNPTADFAAAEGM
jgi:hypothetical protein